jgi:cytoskeletal protein RodZ
MGDFSDRLKEARVSRGLSLHDIAGVTKISMVALEALERGDLSRLPGGIFSRAFVRSYALAVGLDPEQAVVEFLAERERSEHEASRAVAVPEVTADDREFLERQRKAARILRAVVIALGVALIVFVMWKVKLI